MKYLVALFILILFPFLTRAKTAPDTAILRKIEQTQADLKSHAISPEVATKEFRQELVDLKKYLDELLPDPSKMTDEEILKSGNQIKIAANSHDVKVYLPLRYEPNRYMQFVVPAGEASRLLKTPGSFARPVTGRSAH